MHIPNEKGEIHKNQGFINNKEYAGFHIILRKPNCHSSINTVLRSLKQVLRAYKYVLLNYLIFLPLASFSDLPQNIP